MRERCKTCGCFLGFDMGPEGDGDYVCNNRNCKSNTQDYRVNYSPKIICYANCADGCCGYTEEVYDVHKHNLFAEEGLLEITGIRDTFYFIKFK